MRKALYIEHDIEIGTYDIDFAGHVSNIVYLRWLEDMRLKVFDVHCPLKEFLADGVTPVLVSTEIKYRAALKLFDKPRAMMWVSEVSRSSLTIEAEIYLNDKLCTWARHVGVFVDLNRDMKAIRLPERFLNAYRASCACAAEILVSGSRQK